MLVGKVPAPGLAARHYAANEGSVLLAETMLRYPGPSVGLLSGLSRSVRTLEDLETCTRRLRALPAPSTCGD